MFKLINESHIKEIEILIEKISKQNIKDTAKDIDLLIQKIRADIPEKKRISYGRYSIIKQLGQKIYHILEANAVDTYKFAKEIFNETDIDPFVRSFAVQLISIYGEKTKDLKPVIKDIEAAAIDEQWEVRECSAGFVRKLVKAYPDEMKKVYLRFAKSDNHFLRRFSSESIRPVAENVWFKKNPDFCFTIIENLYAEAKDYPRTSVGNNLSDWSRIDKERVFKIVEQLVKSGNKNSYRIAYRACRNLIKTETERVMNILGVDEYKYKKRIHRRK